MFRIDHPIAWTFHRNTSRWLHNVLAPEEREALAASFKEYLDVPLMRLPEPPPVMASFSQVIAQRVSCRRFAPMPLGLEQLSSLLHHAYGVLGRERLGEGELLVRPVPSGGGLYPLECYALIRNVDGLTPGTYHYQPLHHGLEQLDGSFWPKSFISDLFMSQPYVAEAALVLILSAVVERNMWKYEDRGYRYVLFEAGHVAQNLCLTAAGLELGALCLGGFFDIDLARLLELDTEQEVPLYCVAIGPKASLSSSELREAAAS